MKIAITTLAIITTSILCIEMGHGFAISSNPSGRGGGNKNSNKRTQQKNKSSTSNTNKNQRSGKRRSNSKKEIGYSYRSEGIKMKRKRPPRWEVEGDALFFLQEDDDTAHTDSLSSSSNHYYEELFQSVSKIHADESESKRIREFLTLAFQERKENSPLTTKRPSANTPKQKEQEEGQQQSPSNNMMMWGTIPIGPILKSKLETIYDRNSQPTPIQQEAFKVLTKNNKNNNNVVIASPTGSGKTLAYLLPLLATSSKKDVRKILIVTPTLDLSIQIQKVVDQLWGENGVFVMNTKSFLTEESSISNEQIMEWNLEAMLLSKAPIIASTPRVLLQTISACNNNKRFHSIFSNLNTIVLDEADRLLQTELLARHNHDLKHKKRNETTGTSNKSRKQMIANKKVLNDCPTIQLLNALERTMNIPLNVQQQKTTINHSRRPVQLICASATVGRTLRHQIMEITNASSIEKGSILITADDRTGKDANKRKSSLLPNSIQHVYAIATSVNDNDSGEKTLIDSLLKSMKDLNPGSSIIFPGKVGVQKVAHGLQDMHGLKGVKTLRNSDNKNDVNDKEVESWENSSIYVIGEKFGRGLDIADVQYVFISSPPTSPAAYAHLAGRTGRAGNHGVAVTVVRDFKEAKRLLILSNKLGIQFDAIENLQSEEKSLGQREIVIESESADAIVDSDVTINQVKTEEELAQLNVVALKELLRKRSLKVSGKKSELVSRLRDDIISKLD